MASKPSKKPGKNSVAKQQPNGLEKQLRKALDDVTKLLGEARRSAAAAGESAKKSKKSAKKAKKAASKAKAKASASSEKIASKRGGTDASAADSDTPTAPEASESRPVDTTTDHVTPADGFPLPTADGSDVPSNAWTVSRLRALARERGVSGFATMRKSELIEALTAGGPA